MTENLLPPKVPQLAPKRISRPSSAISMNSQYLEILKDLSRFTSRFKWKTFGEKHLRKKDFGLINFVLFLDALPRVETRGV